MPVGDKIRTVDYNTVQTKVANILGTGSASLGYGQPVQSSQVTTSNRVSVNDWGALRNDIINIYRHQNNAIPNTTILPDALEGAFVRYNVTDAPVTVWDTLSTTLQNNRVNALPVGRFGISTSTSQSQTLSFNVDATVTISFEWASTTEARHFFNGGGRLRISSSLTNFLSNAQNTSWNTLLTTTGTREWGGFFPDISVSGTDGRNWHKADSTFREFFSSTASAPYGSNTYKLFARKVNQTVEIRIQLNDVYDDPPAGDPDNPPPGDLVQGTLNVVSSFVYPTGAVTGLGPTTWTEYRPTSVIIGSWSGSTVIPAPPPPDPTPSPEPPPPPPPSPGATTLIVSGNATTNWYGNIPEPGAVRLTGATASGGQVIVVSVNQPGGSSLVAPPGSYPYTIPNNGTQLQWRFTPQTAGTNTLTFNHNASNNPTTQTITVNRNAGPTTSLCQFLNIATSTQISSVQQGVIIRFQLDILFATVPTRSITYRIPITTTNISNIPSGNLDFTVSAGGSSAFVDFACLLTNPASNGSITTNISPSGLLVQNFAGGPGDLTYDTFYGVLRIGNTGNKTLTVTP